jgi:ribonucleotide reductase alpha subunit
MNNKMIAMRPYGSSTMRMGTSTGIEPIFAGHYYSRSLEREITEEGRRRLNQLSEIMRTITDPIKPTHIIKSHKL